MTALLHNPPSIDLAAALATHRHAARRRQQAENRAAVSIDVDLVAAIAWCRANPEHLGRPEDDAAYERAKRLGLLAQDSVWRATTRGEGVLVAVGLLSGSPAPTRATIHCLWATSRRFPRPHFIRAWTDGFADMRPEQFDSERAETEADWQLHDGGPWTFFTTVEYIDEPEADRA